MKLSTCAAVAATLTVLALPVHAEVLDNRPYLSPMYAYTFSDDDRHTKDGQGFYVGGGVPLNKFWNIELGSFYNQFSAKNGSNQMKEFGAKLDGLFFYSRDRAFAPYFGVGVGGQHILVEHTDLESNSPMVDAGLGFLKYFEVSGHDVALRADARYRWQFLDKNTKAAYGNSDTFQEPVLKVGLLVPLGARPTEPVAVAPPPPPPPPPPPVVEPKPAPLPPADSDNDGVPDAQDRCPGTPAGEAVDAYGCSKSQLTKGEERQFNDVLFAFDKSIITKSGKKILDGAAKEVNSGEYKSLRINVAGHTDWVGTEAYNQALSERRARVVKKYLIKKGVKASRIRTFAYGETQPVADNNTVEGRAKNRRTEVRTTAGE